MASRSETNVDTNQVLVEEKNFTRTIILNRPRQLNALSSQMVSRLLELFSGYEDDSNVKLVIVKGQGRAFSAGGDVAAVVHDVNQ
ncbi:3-hydroxyisobutyryl-CoA hydrolase 1-like, partial [Thalictrum thalictroides]